MIILASGIGLGDQNNATIIGVRPWPTTAFIQYLWNEKRLISLEIMIPHDDNFIGGTDKSKITVNHNMNNSQKCGIKLSHIDIYPGCIKRLTNRIYLICFHVGIFCVY